MIRLTLELPKAIADGLSDSPASRIIHMSSNLNSTQTPKTTE
ncbi:hypothetical protein ACEF17_05420 [Streptococcus hyovaginalis]